LGSLLCSRLLLAKIKRPVLALGMIEFMVGLFALASVPLLGMLGQIDYVLTRSGPDAANNTEASGIRPVVGPR
ncbi:MAG: hypothetical protein U9Q07_15425, partial [Planctomycetota bacterium]|nr:hypothetical protein [Planctomycetota bacterium]